ncbi:helix-turn-helix transcriptional regulator [Corynebacterium sp. MSK297]|uniref:helix-turn-helix transcriptional regulator n=1 Tax=Corynebacterium sp. MSK297 TaxID=3050221 RepID=UPI00254C3325|nr:helix-turn-helix transcriptional regulator [Corynebacterium sp. MSK297]MDK8846954.1 helix-turn-helix transcriptional regulator [Corynebacterium sp. MSK297]
MTKAINVKGQIPEWRVQDRLKRAREHAGLSQVELAQLIGVSRATLGNAEQGVRDLKRPVLIAISFATGVSLEWLENGETPKRRKSRDTEIGTMSRDFTRVRHQGIEPRTH